MFLIKSYLYIFLYLALRSLLKNFYFCKYVFEIVILYKIIIFIIYFNICVILSFTFFYLFD